MKKTSPTKYIILGIILANIILFVSNVIFGFGTALLQLLESHVGVILTEEYSDGGWISFSYTRPTILGRFIFHGIVSLIGMSFGCYQWAKKQGLDKKEVMKIVRILSGGIVLSVAMMVLTFMLLPPAQKCNISLEYKPICYSQLAHKEKDLQLCSNAYINFPWVLFSEGYDDDYRSSCHRNYLDAYDNKSFEKCDFIKKYLSEKIEGYRDDAETKRELLGCYGDVMAKGITPVDVKFCEKMNSVGASHSYESQDCLNVYVENQGAQAKSDICSEIIDGDFRDDCYLAFGKSKEHQSLGLCKKINDSLPRDWCLFELAKAGKASEESCEMMETDSTQEICYASLEESAAGCLKYKDQVKTGCLKRLASDKRDSSICKDIEKRIQREACIQDTAKTRTECLTLSSGFARDRCLSNVAELLRDSSTCKDIENVSKKEICVQDTAKTRAECLALSSGFAHDQCLINVSQFLKDVRICEDIDGRSMKMQCVAELKNALETNE